MLLNVYCTDYLCARRDLLAEYQKRVTNFTRPVYHYPLNPVIQQEGVAISIPFLFGPGYGIGELLALSGRQLPLQVG